MKTPEELFNDLDALIAELRHACLEHDHPDPDPDPDPPPPPPTGDTIVIDSTVHISTLHIQPHQTLLFRPGAELVIDDVEPTDAKLANTGLHVLGTWRTEWDGVPGSMVIRSANPAGWRGHVMVMPGADVDIDGIDFVDLGRTDKTIPLSAVNVPGRYALHFHRCGFTKRHKVRNCRSIRSKSWAFVNHSSLVDFEDCRADDSFGSAFVAEAADGQGSFRRCYAKNVDGKPVQGIPVAGGGFQGNRVDEIARMQQTGDIASFGHGFWRDSPTVEITDCTVENSKDQPYFDFPFPYPEFDTGTHPVGLDVRQRLMAPTTGNAAINCGGGHELWHLENVGNRILDTTITGATAPVVSGRFTANQHVLGMQAKAAPGNTSTAVALAGPYGNNSHFGASENRLAKIEGFGVGVTLPSVGKSFLSGVEFVGNEWDISIGRGVSDTEPNVLTFTNVGTPKIKTEGYQTYAFPQEVYTATQRLPLSMPTGEFFIFWREQHPDFVLWTGSNAPTMLRDKTNQQIYDEFGIAPNGFLVPPSAVDHGTYWLAPAANVVEIEIPHRASSAPNGIPGQEQQGRLPVGSRTLTFAFAGVVRTETVECVAGWNAFVFTYDGAKTAFILKGF